MSLLEKGFRILVLVEGTRLKSNWFHPAEVTQMIAYGWQDVTDMSDEEYDATVGRWIGDDES